MDVENHGVTISSDFTDYYDHLLGCSSNETEFTLIRNQRDQLTPDHQIRFLNSRGVPTLTAKELSGSFSPDVPFFLESDGTLCLTSLNRKVEPLVFCKYIKVGHLYAWAICMAPWNDDGTLGEVEIMSIIDNEHKDIDKEIKIKLNTPLCELDILDISGRFLAFRYSTSPNLKEIGLNCIYSPEDIAQAINSYTLPLLHLEK